MSETIDKFKKMMKLAKLNQQRFEKELEQLDHDDKTSNHGEFPIGTLMTEDDLKDSTDDVLKSNGESIKQLNDLKESWVGSERGYLSDISRSLLSIASSLSSIEDHLTKEDDQHD